MFVIGDCLQTSEIACVQLTTVIKKKIGEQCAHTCVYYNIYKCVKLERSSGIKATCEIPGSASHKLFKVVIRLLILPSFGGCDTCGITM